MAASTTGNSASAPRFQAFLPVVIVLVGFVAYLNSFAAGFVWDDTHDIILNRQIQSFWSAVHPPWGGGSYRPVVYLSFALNYAWGGVTQVWSYRVVNLAVHLAAGVVLFGLIRRTLLLPTFRDRFEHSAAWIALATALLWTVHPLQTESVTYIVHRYESFMGFFYLLTLYCVLRGATSDEHAMRWYLAGVVCCALGMGSKEVMITAPVLVLAYDRIFLVESWSELWQRRRGLYAGLAATWGLLWFQIQGALTGRERWAGFGQEHLSPVAYALSQPGVILYYLKLAVWPRDLCIDLAWPAADPSRIDADIIVSTLVIGLLLAGTGWGLLRRSWPGFVGLWFFGILSVTSSIMPVADLAAERRMYLSLAAVMLLFVLAGWGVLETARRRWSLGPTAVAWCAGLVVGVVVAALVLRTLERNGDYYTEEDIWRQVVAQRPHNSRAHANLGTILVHWGKIDEGFLALHTALALNPAARIAHRSLGEGFENIRQDDRALEHFAQAVKNDPTDAPSHFFLGRQYQKRGQLEEAMAQYQAALRLNPDYAEARHKRGTVLFELGHPAEARLDYVAAMTLKPDLGDVYDDLAVFYWSSGEIEGAMRNWHRALASENPPASAHNNLGAALALQGRLDEAMPHLNEALKRDPTLAEPRRFEKARAPLARIAQMARNAGDPAAIHEQLGKWLYEQGRRVDAKTQYQAALKQRPDSAAAHEGLGMLLWLEGKQPEALTEWRRAIELDPKLAAAHNHLGVALAIQDKLDEALKHLDEAVRLDATLADAQHHRAVILGRTNRLDEAARAYRAAVDLKPKNADYRCGLAHTLHRLGQTEAARKEYDEAIRIDPNWPQRALRDAWVLAVHPEDKKRNGRHALQLAQRVCEAVKDPGAVDLDVLAAAQAENEKFDEAAATARQAAQRASRDGLTNLVAPIEKRQALYQARKPFRATGAGGFFPGNE